MGKHTQGKVSVGDSHLIYDEDGHELAMTFGNKRNDMEANAARIALTWNSHDELVVALQAAIRYIEVSCAYQGAMTASQVEGAIKEIANVSRIEIGANSCNTLASFDMDKARAALKRATQS